MILVLLRKKKLKTSLLYNAAHNNATSQTSTDGYQQINYDKNGKQTDILYKSGKAEAILKIQLVKKLL